MMNSRFYYPTNTGSLGEPRRAASDASPRQYQRPMEFEGSKAVTSVKRERTVLLVEDDDNCLFLLTRALGSKGYRVVQAWDGKQALELTRAEHPDLVLLDLQLPRLNGIDVITQLRGSLDFEALPIVIMTGHEPERYRASAISAGCDDFILKPIDFDRLDAVLDYFVPLRPFLTKKCPTVSSKCRG
jgi:CheY-like chemotaxis protein